MLTRGISVRLGLLVLSTAMVLLAVEIALRVHARATDPARVDVPAALEKSRRAELPTGSETASLLGLVRPSADPATIYELKPNLDGSFLGRPVRTNSHSMRGREISREKPAGVRRIIGLGDSVMFGWGVHAEESYMGILADELGGGSRPIEVLNLAVPGYNTVMEVAGFRSRALAFDPDLVLLHVVNNDLDLPRFLLQPRRVWRLDRWYLLDLVRGVTRGGAEGHWLEPRDLPALDPAERQRVDERFGFLVGRDAFAGAISDLAETCTEHEVPVIVLVSTCDGEMWSDVCSTVSDHRLEIVPVGPRLGRYLEEHHSSHTREDWIRTFWVSPTDPHPNPLAHEIHSHAILEKLAEIGFLQG